MTADILRRAAADMRAKAEAATPGPWCFYGDDLWRGTVDELERFDTQTDEGDHWSDLDADHLFHGDPVRTADADHIAAWHPAVALAVADLLDNCAGHVEYSGDVTSEDVLHCLTLARTYLNEQP